jgi:hypothetical protein
MPYTPYTIATTTTGVNLTTSLITEQAAAFKTALALDAVNNTSDANKPVSAPQQAALDLKASKTLIGELLYSPASLDYAFADDKAFLRNTSTTNGFSITARKGPSLNYTRATAATTVDSDGLVKFSPENLLLISEAFNNGSNGTTTPWNPSAGQAFGSGSVANDTGTLAPDGTYSANKFLEASSGSGQTILRQTYTFEPSTAYTFSVYAKHGGTRPYLVLYCSDGTGHQQTFNLSTGAKGTYSNAILSSSMTAAGNGWYRCSITWLSSTSPNTNAVDIRYENTDDNGDTNYTRSGAYNWLWGAQLERATGVRQYLPTTTSAVYGPRFWHDPADLTSRGLLLETASTNILWPSNIFSGWSYLAATCGSSNATATLDPAGTYTADSILETTVHDVHSLQYAISGSNIANATKYTFSCFVKPNGRNYCKLTLFPSTSNGATGSCVFSLSNGGSIISEYSPIGSYPTIKAFPNGWYRISMTSSVTTSVSGGAVAITIGTTSNCAAYQGDITKGLYLYGAQVEAGERASSYIPTYTGTVARAAAACNMVNNDFASIYNQSEGTVKLSITPLDPATNTSYGIFGIDAADRTKANISISRSGSDGNYIIAAKMTKGPGGGWTDYSSVASYTASGWTPTVTKSLAFAYKNANCNAAFNGVSQTATTNTILPTEPMTQLTLGANGSNSGQQTSSSLFSRLTIYKSRISDEYLKIATS